MLLAYTVNLSANIFEEWSNYNTMIKLYGFGPAFGLIDPSPFVTKIDLSLRHFGIEFESIADQRMLPKAPKKKFPFIDDDGHIVADSVFILDYLKQKYAADTDQWLTPEQKAIAQLVSKSLDENLYWTIMYSRWLNEDTWPVIRKQFFDPLPFPLNKIIAKVARKSTIKQINGHGMGKHSNDEVNDIANRSLNSLSVLLGDKDYFFGKEISSLDITVFAMVSGLTLSSIDNELSRIAREHDNLVSFTKRMKEAYYPELS